MAQIKMLWHVDPQTVMSQPCAICGKMRQRVVPSATRPDFVICDGCHSAYVIEDGPQRRLLYGQVPALYPQTRQFALKQWHSYVEIFRLSNTERKTNLFESAAVDKVTVTTAPTPTAPEVVAEPVSIEPGDDPRFLFRRLRETGELPNIDHLFEDKRPKSG